MASTVTFTGADDGTVLVRHDNREFPLDTPVPNVGKETVEALQALPGLKFDITDKPEKGDDKPGKGS